LEIAIATCGDLLSPALCIHAGAIVGKLESGAIRAMIASVGAGWWRTGSNDDRAVVDDVTVERPQKRNEELFQEWDPEVDHSTLDDPVTGTADGLD
jgi:hypothetical protein